jgi:hypothetical protein
MRISIKRVKRANMWCLTTWEETKQGTVQKQQWFHTEDEAKAAVSVDE